MTYERRLYLILNLVEVAFPYLEMKLLLVLVWISLFTFSTASFGCKQHRRSRLRAAGPRRF